MTAKKEGKKRIYHKLRNKFRMVILNDDTFEEKFSLILSPLNVFTWGGLVVILLVVAVFLLLAYTPLKQLVPGYGDIETKKLAVYAALKADSLEEEMGPKNLYLSNLQGILQGKPIDPVTHQGKDTSIKYDELKLTASREDSVLRAEIEADDMYNLSFLEESTKRDISSYFFFTPMRGLITSTFNPDKNHYGVDVIAPKNEAVKATLNGTVILSTWTSETGHVIQLQHDNNLISVYKHNSVLLKTVGESVKAGEAIAIVGESGELTDGPHLHFELWYSGRAIDPQKYMVF